MHSSNTPQSVTAPRVGIGAAAAAAAAETLSGASYRALLLYYTRHPQGPVSGKKS